MQKVALQIVRKLQSAGHTAYFAGGAVRDLLLDKISPLENNVKSEIDRQNNGSELELSVHRSSQSEGGRRVSDIDIATSARPEEVEKLFPRTHPIGREFGVILVISGRQSFEVATFRGESDYDGRRPGKVFFTDVKEDATRRDFTINGLFYDPEQKKILDFVHGQHDLKLRIIRFIGEANERIQEDHLRLLRAVRFRNSLQFEYEPKTATAVKKYAPLIRKISNERIRDELNKMLTNEYRAEAIRDLDRFGLLSIILPELVRLKGVAQPPEYHTEGDTFTHSLGSLAALNLDPSPLGGEPACRQAGLRGVAVCWATLLHDLGKAETVACKIGSHHLTFPAHARESAKIAERILRRLHFDNATRAKIVWLVREHMTLGSVTKMRPAHRHRFFTHPWFPDLMRVCHADIAGTRPADFELYREVQQMWHEETKAKLLPAPQKFLTGSEIMQKLHLPPSPEIGRLKGVLYDAQIEGLVKNKEEAIRFLERCIKR